MMCEGEHTLSRLRDISHFKFDSALFQKLAGESRIDRVVKSNQPDLPMTALDFLRSQLFCNGCRNDLWHWSNNNRLSRFEPSAAELATENVPRTLSQLFRSSRQIQQVVIRHRMVEIKQPLPLLVRFQFVHRQRISPPYSNGVPAIPTPNAEASVMNGTAAAALTSATRPFNSRPPLLEFFFHILSRDKNRLRHHLYRQRLAIIGIPYLHAHLLDRPRRSAQRNSLAALQARRNRVELALRHLHLHRFPPLNFPSTMNDITFA